MAEATPRALLRAQVVVLVVPEGSEAPRLALVVLEAAVALEVALVAEEVADRGADHSEVGAGAQEPGPQDPAGAAERRPAGRLGPVLLCLDGHPVTPSRRSWRKRI